jgi:hypothetical protein
MSAPAGGDTFVNPQLTVVAREFITTLGKSRSLVGPAGISLPTRDSQPWSYNAVHFITAG